jgi:hypothetical protein
MGYKRKGWRNGGSVGLFSRLLSMYISCGAVWGGGSLNGQTTKGGGIGSLRRMGGG